MGQTRTKPKPRQPEEGAIPHQRAQHKGTSPLLSTAEDSTDRPILAGVENGTEAVKAAETLKENGLRQRASDTFTYDSMTNNRALYSFEDILFVRLRKEESKVMQGDEKLGEGNGKGIP